MSGGREEEPTILQRTGTQGLESFKSMWPICNYSIELVSAEALPLATCSAEHKLLGQTVNFPTTLDSLDYAAAAAD